MLAVPLEVTVADPDAVTVVDTVVVIDEVGVGVADAVPVAVVVAVLVTVTELVTVCTHANKVVSYNYKQVMHGERTCVIVTETVAVDVLV